MKKLKNCKIVKSNSQLQIERLKEEYITHLKESMAISYLEASLTFPKHFPHHYTFTNYMRNDSDFLEKCSNCIKENKAIQKEKRIRTSQSIFDKIQEIALKRLKNTDFIDKDDAAITHAVAISKFHTSRLDPDYADKKQVDVNATLSISDRLRRAQQAAIDHDNTGEIVL